MFFWHIGASVGFIRYAFRDPHMDLRFLALGAVLSDIVDLPVAILFWSSYETDKLVGHSTMFAVVLMVAVLVLTRRGLWRKRLILLATGVLLHLALDAMWQSPETLWWPFFGSEFTRSGFATYGAYVSEVVSNPWVWVGEIVGLVYLVALWRKADLSKASVRKTFMRTGVVSAPIDRV
jgi:glucan phosphoethanolaminetransferase (alkaline phosphatase superfamily)